MRLLAAVVLVVAALALVRAESDPDFSFDDFLEAPETGNEEQQHEGETVGLGCAARKKKVRSHGAPLAAYAVGSGWLEARCPERGAYRRPVGWRGLTGFVRSAAFPRRR